MDRRVYARLRHKNKECEDQKHLPPEKKTLVTEGEYNTRIRLEYCSQSYHPTCNIMPPFLDVLALSIAVISTDGTSLPTEYLKSTRSRN